MAEDDSSNWGRYAGLGLEVAVGAIVGVAIGWWLDKRYGFGPWGTVIGAALGLAAGMYLLIKAAIRINKD